MNPRSLVSPRSEAAGQVAVPITAATSAAIPGRALLGATAAASWALAALGGWCLTHPESNPLREPGSVVLRHVLGAEAVTAALVSLAVIGGLAVFANLPAPAGGAGRTVLAAVSLAEVFGLGVVLQSVSTMSLAGYLVAMALPFGLAWVAIQAIRRYRRVRWIVLAAVVAAAGWGVMTGAFRPHHLAGLAGDLGRGFAAHAAQLILAVLTAAAAACWVVVAVRALPTTRPVLLVGSWVVRHRRALTILAAAGPLPYGLIRASWLTPWPLLVPPGQALDPEMQLWGLLLGGGALLGAVLTIGLIRPWGLVFPRWMPWFGGRPVPVRAAVVPGGLVAGITCASAIPMLQAILAPDWGTVFTGLPLVERLVATLIFPFWIWGPALALAVWGYALARRS